MSRTVVISDDAYALLLQLSAQQRRAPEDVILSLLQDATPAASPGGTDELLRRMGMSDAEIAAAKADREGARLRYVEIGAASGQDIDLPSAVLRASAIELMGSGTGSIDGATTIRVMHELFAAAGEAGLTTETRIVPLRDITANWAMDDTAARTVFVP